MNSIIKLSMIQRFLNFAIRKDITKKNKKFNHRAFVRSMTLGDKIPYLAKYHKKKIIASILALVIIYTYDLQKRTFILIQQFIDILFRFVLLCKLYTPCSQKRRKSQTLSQSKTAPVSIFLAKICNSSSKSTLLLTNSYISELVVIFCFKYIRIQDALKVNSR